MLTSHTRFIGMASDEADVRNEVNDVNYKSGTMNAAYGKKYVEKD